MPYPPQQISRTAVVAAVLAVLLGLACVGTAVLAVTLDMGRPAAVWHDPAPPPDPPGRTRGPIYDPKLGVGAATDPTPPTRRNVPERPTP